MQMKKSQHLSNFFYGAYSYSFKNTSAAKNTDAMKKYPNIFRTSSMVHTFILAFKNICVAKNTNANETTYGECNGITRVT